MIDRVMQRLQENFITLDSSDGNAFPDVDKSKLKANYFSGCVILLWQVILSNFVTVILITQQYNSNSHLKVI